MSVDRYRSRKLHAQRQFDPLYIAAALAVIAYAVTVATHYGVRIDLTHITLDVVAFGLFVPLTSFGIGWNETRPMFVGRVDYWQESGWLYRRLPGVICVDVTYRVVLYYAALPALLIGGISTGFVDRALWTYGFLAVFVSIAYTLLAVALALWGRIAFMAGITYVLVIENLLPNWISYTQWISVKQWAYAAAHVLPHSGLLPASPVPTWAGWVFTYVLALIAILWASRRLKRQHTIDPGGLVQTMKSLRKMSGLPPEPVMVPRIVQRRRMLRRGPPIVVERPEEPVTPWPENPPPPAPPDLIARVNTDGDTDTEGDQP